MKTSFIKALALCAAILCQTTAMAQKEETMVVHLKNGNTISYELGNIDYIDVVKPDPSKQQEVEGLGGTVADAVDLGLSVKWAAHNCGSYSPGDAGAYLTWSEGDNAAALWGNGWRLPTDAEWQELFSQCTSLWVVYNGVCGRLITSKLGNNKTIFIPAAGINMEDGVKISDAAGIYWSSDKDPESTNKEGTGAYFDSANLYNMQYPLKNTMTVRLVKD